jgi:hypothetical protein
LQHILLYRKFVLYAAEATQAEQGVGARHLQRQVPSAVQSPGRHVRDRIFFCRRRRGNRRPRPYPDSQRPARTLEAVAPTRTLMDYEEDLGAAGRAARMRGTGRGKRAGLSDLRMRKTSARRWRAGKTSARRWRAARMRGPGRGKHAGLYDLRLAALEQAQALRECLRKMATQRARQGARDLGS